jgi:phage/plasmid-like protein (TIGR03299 family)
MGFITQINSLDDIDTFKVEKAPLFFEGKSSPVPDTFSLRRVDNHEHLGVVGKNYRPIQLEEMVDVLDRASNKVGDIKHIGYTTSRGGRKALIQSKLTKNINVDGDIIEPYFYTVVDNTGMGSNKTIPSTMRIACDNAFHLINKDSSLAMSSRHASNFDERVFQMEQEIVNSINVAQRFNDTVVKLKSQRFSRDQMIKLTQSILPLEKDESTKRVHKREKLVELFEGGRGNVGETKWDALNAITEFETHTGKQSSSKLIRNLVSGGNLLSQRGLQLLAA